MIYKTYKYLQSKKLLLFKLGMIGICLTANLALAHSNPQKLEKLEIYESIGGNFTLQSSRNHLVSLGLSRTSGCHVFRIHRLSGHLFHHHGRSKTSHREVGKANGSGTATFHNS